MTRSTLPIALVLLAFAVAGCSNDSPSAGTSAESAPPPDDGSFAVLPGDGFRSDGSFDARMTCDSPGDYSPPLVFRHVPTGTTELLVSMVDEDKTSPQGDPLIHWVEWKIPPTSAGLTEHVKPDQAREGLNDLHEATYVGPCPPPGQTHHYRFTLLALSKSLNLPYGSAVRTVLQAAKPFVLDTATFVAAYHRRTLVRRERLVVIDLSSARALVLRLWPARQLPPLASQPGCSW
ncbi:MULTISPECIES: YbhB/YbcL family Raf kinase inhibitor-like protein [Kribbella]|nr:MULTISPECIES: YbhB/YbcL family Raf kinase inhibitor-like protein [Kribbella]